MPPPDTLITRLPFPILLLPLVLLTILTATSLILYSITDPHLHHILEPCSSAPGSLLPLTPGSLAHHVPVLGTPMCYVASLLERAASSRAAYGGAVMGEFLAFWGALLTVALLESARMRTSGRGSIWAGPRDQSWSAWVVRSPMPAWLVSGLASVAGAVVWQLGVVPMYLKEGRRGRRQMLLTGKVDGDCEGWRRTETAPLLGEPSDAAASSSSSSSHSQRADTGKGTHTLEEQYEESWDAHMNKYPYRQIHTIELYAIPLGVIVGYLVPSTWLLWDPHTSTVLLWLFFPVLVSLARSLLRMAITAMGPFPASARTHVEASLGTLMVLYTVPMLWSVVARVCLAGEWVHRLLVRTRPDDEAAAAMGYLQIEAIMVAAAVAYWLLVETGARPVGWGVLAAVLFGPGAGVCVAWVARENWMVWDGRS